MEWKEGGRLGDEEEGLTSVAEGLSCEPVPYDRRLALVRDPDSLETAPLVTESEELVHDLDDALVYRGDVRVGIVLVPPWLGIHYAKS